MLALLGVSSVIGFLVCVVLLVKAKLKKNGKVKKWGIGTGICFVIFVIALIITPGLTPEQIAQAKTANELKVKQAAEVEAKTAADKVIADAKTQVDAQLKTEQDAKNKIEADKVAAAKAVADKVTADAKAVEDKKAADAKAVEDKKVADAAAYQTWVKGQFSVWDGSNTYLVDLVKENLNDAKSFEHVETKYADKGSFLTVKMTYRAKNAFGGVILQNVTANSDYKTDTIRITSQND